MTVLACDGGRYRFADVVADAQGYSAHPWREDEPVSLAEAATRGVPLPRDGSLLGYAVGRTFTAVIPFYTRRPEPCWSVMPLAGEHRDLWPPFTAESLAGPWLWRQVRQGRIADLGPMIAAHPGAVFWAATHAGLGADCCAVARDITARRTTLRRGAYVYHRVLAAGAAVPPLGELLAAGTDLAPRFSPSRH